MASLFPLWVAWCVKDTSLNDDTYITLTFAKNLARGDGFIYNHQPATLGTTSPLLALSVGLLAGLSHVEDIQVVAVSFTALCWIAIPWTIFLFRRAFGLEDWQAAVIGLALMASGWVANLGMEAYLFAFLLTLSIALLVRRNFLLAGTSTGLLFLARGEGVLLIFVLLLALLVSELAAGNIKYRSMIDPVVRLLTGFSVAPMAWILYAWFIFGSFLPNTFEVKKLQGQEEEFLPFFRTLVMDWLPNFGKQLILLNSPVLNIGWILACFGIGHALARRRKFIIFPVWIAIYAAGYSLLGVAAYPWYRLPVLFVFQIMAALGLTGIMILLFRLLPSKWLKLFLPAGIALLYLFFLGRPTAFVATHYAGDARGPGYKAMCDWFRENADPDASIAYVEVGYLGYYTDNRIIDLAGLVTPDVIPHLKEHDTDWAFEYYNPDYIVRQKDFDEVNVFKPPNPEIIGRYQLVATFPGQIENVVNIYRKRI